MATTTTNNVCSVCVEKYHRGYRPPVQCVYCNFECCTSCIQNYLLSINEHAKCMSCSKPWSKDFIDSTLSKKFRNGAYKTHYENILFEKERALFPECQYIIEEAKGFDVAYKELHVEYQDLDRKMAELYDQMERLRVSKRQLLRGDTNISLDKAKKKFIRPCPSCNGFLGEDYKCGVCETEVCEDCFAILEGQHECTKEDIETANEVKASCKNCPQCGVPTFKTEGCFGENTPILMWNGSIKMSQDIIVGDILVGDDGNPRIVQELCTGEDDLYYVHQNKGIDYIVSSKHKIVVKYCSDGYIGWRETENAHKLMWFDRETLTLKTKKQRITEDISYEQSREILEEYKKKLPGPGPIEILMTDYMNIKDKTKTQLSGYKAEFINWERKEVLMDPYLLGVWIGDGLESGSTIASNDIEVQEYILNWCIENNCELVHQDKYAYRIRRKNQTFGKGAIGSGSCDSCKACAKARSEICDVKLHITETNLVTNMSNPFKDQLRHYNLLGNKHIPMDYIVNSKEVRLQILAGIIDTDGHVSNEGKRVSISQKREHVVQQIELLARSLGFVVNISIQEKKNIKFHKDDEPKDYDDLFVINISGTTLDEIPTRVIRKKCSSSNPNKDYLRTGVNVTAIGRGTYYGWRVDGNHRFLLADTTVVRNCDQMYCMQCHTAWDWITQTIETGRIHNPHYYEWLRTQNNGEIPREQGDEICGGFPTAFELLEAKGLFEIIHENEEYMANRNLILGIWRCIGHATTSKRRYFHQEGPNENLDLRLSFIQNQITVDVFKAELERRDKTKTKRMEIYQVMDTLSIVGTEIIKKYQNNDGDDAQEVLVTEMLQLKDFINQSFLNLKKRFGTSMPNIDDKWDFKAPRVIL